MDSPSSATAVARSLPPTSMTSAPCRAPHPDLSRRAFSQRLCAHWDWRQPNGALRDMLARSLLLVLHRAGHIALPPVRRQPPNNAIARRRPAAVDVDVDPLEGPPGALQPLELVAVRRTPQEGLYDHLIAAHHYLGPAHGVGEQIKYLAFARAARWPAWGSPPRPGIWARATASSAGRHRCAGRMSMSWPTTPAS